jgi:hypothetical protein
MSHLDWRQITGSLSRNSMRTVAISLKLSKASTASGRVHAASLELRQLNFSRTVWITFHCRGTTSSVSVTSSPSFTSLPPQAGQAHGAGMTTRSRQMPRQGRPHRPTAGKALDRRIGRSGLRHDRTPSRIRLQLLELQLQLVKHLATALGGLAVLIATELGDHQLQMRDHRRRARGAGFGRGQLLALPPDQPSAGDGHRNRPRSSRWHRATCRSRRAR